MKSFKLYIVSLLVFGIAVGCADENRAFKPKSTLGTLGAKGRGTPAGQNPANTPAPTTAEDEEKKKAEAEAEAKRKAEEEKKRAEEQLRKELGGGAAGGQENIPDANFKNANGGSDSKATVAVKPDANVAAGGKKGQGQEAGAQAKAVNQSEEEQAYIKDPKKRLEAIKVIQGVKVYRSVVAENNKYAIEILWVIEIDGQKEVITSRGELAQPTAEADGDYENFNSMISKQDKDYSIDDIVKVRARCISKGSCDEITIVIGVRYTSKKDNKEELVIAYAGYRFKVGQIEQGDDIDAIELSFNGSTVGNENFKSFESALGWTSMPKFKKKVATEKPVASAAPAVKADGVEQVNVDAMSKEAAAHRKEITGGENKEKNEGQGKGEEIPFKENRTRNFDPQNQGGSNDKGTKETIKADPFEQVNVDAMSKEASAHVLPPSAVGSATSVEYNVNRERRLRESQQKAHEKAAAEQSKKDAADPEHVGEISAKDKRMHLGRTYDEYKRSINATWDSAVSGVNSAVEWLQFWK